MTDSVGNIHSLDTSEPPFARREWELRERIDELQSELTERIERERIRELELVSQRHELEVRFAYNAMLEQRVLDHANQIEWLLRHCEVEANRFAAEQGTAAVEFESRYAEIARELAEKHEYAHAARLRMEELERERDAVRSDLDAERRRISYRMLQRVAVRMKKHPFLSSLLRRAGRFVAG